MSLFHLDVRSDDGIAYRTDISPITLMFFDTVMAELSCNCGAFEYFEYEDEDGDRIAIRSDDDMSAFVTFLEKEQAAIIWLVRAPPVILDDIPVILPTDLKRLNLISHGQMGSVYRLLISRPVAFITTISYLKPNNILVNSSGYVKLSDFGLSKVMEHSITRTYVGTTRYMAPERIRGGVYRIESDIWSFGLSLWELALGRFPFPTVSADELSTAAFSDVPDVRSCPTRITDLPKELQELIYGCLQHDVQQRWKANDLMSSDYIKAAYPMDRCVIKEFIARNMPI
ncbi:unnamed protein product [Heligmosomoides polygyrus]|uniref:mitogen-activated protein kinase kinase n=1 Tax=Heligmosomoides polygyrus TaxID=6339 RepID=A0A183G341_HELPZ|nr:unnamed protein product [Heligmosomoides polygyrus]